MLAVSCRFSLKKIAAIIFCICIAFYGVSTLYTMVFSSSKATISVTEGEMLKLPKVKENEERLEIISALGWEVEPEPVLIKEVIIPIEADELLSSYNEIQIAQGLNLEDYLGKRVKQYSYEVLNHPEEKEDVWLSIYVYDDEIVAGDVSFQRVDGFTHGLVI